MFDDLEFLLCNVRYVPELKKILLSISVFYYLGYFTRVKHMVLKIFHGDVIIAEGSKIYNLYILEDSNVVVHSSSFSEDFHNKNKLWDLRLGHG